jgi:plasmid maintenance system antidote protein VapI
MKPNASFRRFVDSYESQAAAARALGRSRVTVNRVYHGHLPVSLQVARRVEALTDRRITVSDLLALDATENVMLENGHA